VFFSQPKFSIRQANNNDLKQLTDLVYYEVFIHRHLDYRPPLDWINQQPFLILERNHEIIAALAAPPDPVNISWIRLFVTSQQSSPEKSWNILWPKVQEILLSQPKFQVVGAIPIYRWFELLLARSGFSETTRIVMLNWEGTQPIHQVTKPSLHIRSMSTGDLDKVQEIDTTAFSPLWRNSTNCLEFAFHQSIISTIAEYQDQPIGYLISTPTGIGVHLARLAVLHQYQGMGFGYALLYNLLMQMSQSEGRVVTVNTQMDNQASLSLYRKAGFQLTGENYPILTHLPPGQR
jgi:ribosomal protein S18 acetylase RimI-like enzyme